MQRKLASVVRVVDVSPIANADRIELARVGGWQCVVKKGEVRAGDLAVYLEIDAVPPDTAQYSWLWQPKASAAPVPRPEKFRIRTATLRGALSQGLLLPLEAVGLADVREGDDVTEPLGVTKYEPPPPNGMGEYRGPFPGLVPKTDEQRVQSAPGVLEELRGQPFVATVKMDGTSATFVMLEGQLHACGRNHSVLEGDNLYWYVAAKRRIGEVLVKAPHLAIQGEIVGPGLQKNPVGLKDKDLFVFSVLDTRTARYFGDAELRAFCREHALEPVPIAFEGERFDETVDSLLAKAEGLYPGTTNQREGIVVRPREERRSEVLAGRLSFKAISNAYLLGESD